MFKITNRLIISKTVKRLEVKAEDIARHTLPGQFVIIIPQEKGEWIPLSVVDADKARGTITLIFQEVGDATRQLGALPINEEIFSVLGPFGVPATIKRFGTVICAASGSGVAQMLPICRAFKEFGNKVIGVIGAPTRGAIILEPQMRLASNKVIIATEDGSFDRRGTASLVVKDLLEKEDVKLVYAIGAVGMMQEICELTRKKNIKTLVQLNANISCGSGICGSCRVNVDEKTVLACQHGPEFDGHKVDFDVLRIRTKAFRKVNIHWDEEKMKTGLTQAESVAKFLPGLLGK